MKRYVLAVMIAIGLATTSMWAQATKAGQLKPTAANVKYGPHPRNVLDFYQAKSDKPTPMVLYIHGGGWRGGDKKGYNKATIQQYLKKGISYAAINYRFVQQAGETQPPVKAPLHDAARALQFIRSKANEWNLDKKRVGATGGSAGGCSSLWLAFHDDLADPKSKDPIARESTRLYCAAVNGAQTTLDPTPLREWMPNYGYGAHAFGLKNFQALIDNRSKVLAWIKEYSPMEHVTKDDPPIFMTYNNSKTLPKKGDKPRDPTHSALLGFLLEQKVKSVGGEIIIIGSGRSHPKYKSIPQYLMDRLTK